MKFKLINESGEKTFVLIFEKGDEVIGTLKQFASEQRLLASHFTAIGALSSVVLGFFDPGSKQYRRIAVSEQVEVLSLAGDVTIQDGRPAIHAHIVVGKSDGTAHGGHLMDGRVFPTLELILMESPKYLRRRFDAETGLALIDLSADNR
jgi:predicted DNA-binding protein with PD1-like motif